MKAIPGIAVRAVAAAVPTHIVRTQDYEFLTPEERQRFQKVTGIAERRIVGSGQCASDLCAFAADRAIAHAGWERESIGALILVTQSPDYPIPATAVILQDKLKLSQTCIAFDVNLGCSAYPYGVAIVASMMKSLSIQRALLLVGDISSRSCAIHDKSAWPLFGDAGSATALELQDDVPEISLDLMSDGAGKDAIIVPSGTLSSRRPRTDDAVQMESGSDGIMRYPDNLILRGADIFSFAIAKVPSSIQRALEASQCKPEQIDFLVLHQANKMINDTITKKAGFRPEQALSTLAQYGNTSSASIPVTLCAHADRFDQGRKLALCGFGVGLSWGACIMSVPAHIILPVIETDNVY
jgi:3-oxoacyl-[acyl-carrier-protein] synthase III